MNITVQGETTIDSTVLSTTRVVVREAGETTVLPTPDPPLHPFTNKHILILEAAFVFGLLVIVSLWH